MRLAQHIAEAAVPPGEIALFSLSQAGFCFKTPAGKTLWLDPYLTDCCEREFGFRRMIPALVTPAEVAADVFLVTHSHLDHLDTDALPTIAPSPRTHFVGAADCGEAFAQCGLSPDRYTLLRPGDRVEREGIGIQAVYCDHGKLAPEALGVVLTFDGLRVYVTGDTAFSPEPILASLPLPVDVMIAPINGAFGNLNSREACARAALIGPRLLIPCHFWMFVEQGGDPAACLACAAESLPEVAVAVLAPGEELRYSVAGGLLSRRTFAPEAD